MTETTTIIVFWELCCLIHNMKHQSPLLQVKIYCSIYKKILHKNKWKQDIMLEFFYIMIMFTGIFFGSWQSDKKQLIYRISYCFQFSLCQNNLPSFSLSYLSGPKNGQFPTTYIILLGESVCIPTYFESPTFCVLHTY